jgi:hypothetical protein
LCFSCCWADVGFAALSALCFSCCWADVSSAARSALWFATGPSNDT